MTSSRNLQLLFISSLLLACGESADHSDSKDQFESTTNNNVERAVSINESEGEQIYHSLCLPCHAEGPGHPGTMRLAERLGNDKAILAQRDDLHIDYVKNVVRQGIMLMPPFRPSEITDSELDALAAFLAPETGN